MRRAAAFLAAIAFCAVGSAYALYEVSDEGRWPKTWPGELEPLRAQSRSLTGGLINVTCHEIPFSKREEFESAWPHLLTLKSKGAPVILVRGPHKHMGAIINAGVVIQCPPPQTGDRPVPAEPLPGNWTNKERGRWIWTTFIEVVVDGAIVDLNRIPLPPDTPIIDERFKDGDKKTSDPSGG